MGKTGHLRYRFLVSFGLLVLALLVTACGGSPQQPATYTVSGTVKDDAGVSMAGVTLQFSGTTDTVRTGEEGKWTSPRLQGKVTITPVHPEYDFHPATRSVSKAVSGMNFTGTKKPDATDSGPGDPEPDPDPDPDDPDRCELIPGEPIPICTLDDLQAMRDNPDADYVLMNDIDASETRTWPEGFEPIGKHDPDDPDAVFTGSFDGRGHAINELYIHRPEANEVGLFGRMGTAARVSNVRIEGGEITGNKYVGALVGYNEGSHENIFNSASVSGGDYVGGIIGYHKGYYQDGTLEDLHNSGSVTGGERVGGIVGFSEDAALTNLENDGVIVGDRYVGGIAGYIFGYYSTVQLVSHLSNSGDVTGKGGEFPATMTGGIAGQMTMTNAKHLTNSGAVTGKNYTAGLVGRFEQGDTNATTYIQHGENSGFVSGHSFVGGLIANVGSKTKVSYMHNTGSVEGGLAVGGVVGSSHAEVGYVSNAGDVTGLSPSPGSGSIGSIGGVAGSQVGVLEYAYNTGEVVGNGGTVGGIIGSFQGDILRAYNLGSVTTPLINANSSRGENYGYDHIGVGGAIGAVSRYTFVGRPSKVTEVYNAGEVIITEHLSELKFIGGLIGNNVYEGGYGGDVFKSYWDMDTVGSDVRPPGDEHQYGTGLTTEQMYDPDAYEDWDLTRWAFTGGDYPDLSAYPR